MPKMKVKLDFKLLSINMLYDGIRRAEALNTYGLVALCVDRARIRVNTLPRARSLAWHGEMPTPSRRRVPYWGRTRFCNTFRRQNGTELSPKKFHTFRMERGYKAVLLVAEAKVQGF